MSDERMIRVDNLKLLMKNNSISKADLSKMLGTSDSYVSKLLSGRPGTFGEKAARKVEEKFKKPRFWLDEVHPQGNYSEQSLDEANKLPTGEREARAYGYPLDEIPGPSAFKLLPVITWEQLNMLQEKNTRAAFKFAEHIATDGQVTENAKWLQMAEADTSMGDRLPPGTRLLVEPVEPGATITPGSFVIVQLANMEHMVRRYKQVTKDRFMAEPLNPAYATLDSQDTPMKVVALVTQAIVRL